MKVQEDNLTLFDIKKERKGRQEDRIEVRMQWKAGTVSTEYFAHLYTKIPAELAVYTKGNNTLEEDWNRLN